jgi:hypothetical protein
MPRVVLEAAPHVWSYDCKIMEVAADSPGRDARVRYHLKFVGAIDTRLRGASMCFCRARTVQERLWTEARGDWIGNRNRQRVQMFDTILRYAKLSPDVNFAYGSVSDCRRAGQLTNVRPALCCQCVAIICRPTCPLLFPHTVDRQA